MKKFLLVMMALLSIFGMSVKAQSFEFQYQGESVQDGDTVTIKAETNVFGELSCETNPSANPNNGLVLRIPETMKGRVNAQLEILNNTLNARMVQWCMGEECIMVGNNTSLTKAFDAKEIITVLLEASNIQGSGSLMAKLSVSLNGQSRVVFVQFTNGDTTGIHRMQQTSASQRVYGLNGQLLSHGKGLSKGICIVNGNKVVIK